MQTENVVFENGRIVVVLTVPKGFDKPYFDKNGVIWLKCGADKRRVNSTEDLTKLLQNMNLATDAGVLNLAGVILFAERPEWIKPQFVVKAIRYPGNAIHVSDYVDTEDFSGPFAQGL